MRALAASLCGFLAVLAALVALPAGWVGANVADEDGYVAFSSTLATDAEAREAVAGAVAKEIVSEADLPDELTSTLTAILEDTAARVAGEPGFVRVWAETQRLAHRSVFDSGNGEQAGVDVAPLAQFLIDAAAGSLPVDVDVPETLVVELGPPDQRSVDLIRAASGLAWLTTAAAVVAATCALLLARRRSTALMWLGLGALAVAAVLAVGSRVPLPRLIEDRTSPSEFEGAFQQVLVDRAADSFAGWLIWVAAVGVVAIGAGVLLRVGSSRSRSHG